MSLLLLFTGTGESGEIVIIIGIANDAAAVLRNTLAAEVTTKIKPYANVKRSVLAANVIEGTIQ